MSRRLAMILALVVLTLACSATSARAQKAAKGKHYASPAWNQTLSSLKRFVVLSNMNGEGVLDRETGLVWQKTPFTQAVDGFRTWQQALTTCPTISVGNRFGWRLPTVQELGSLLDATVDTTPRLPVGHPFGPLFTTAYWSATDSATLPSAAAWILSLTVGGNDGLFIQNSGSGFGVWCVRGGSGADAQ